MVVFGIATCTIDDEVISPVPAIRSTSLGAKHRLANDGEEELVIVEVQHGAYTGEDDIVRFEDDFGRAAEAPQVGPPLTRGLPPPDLRDQRSAARPAQVDDVAGAPASRVSSDAAGDLRRRQQGVRRVPRRRPWSRIGVPVRSGLTQFTRTPAPAHSSARAWVRFTTAALAEE